MSVRTFADRFFKHRNHYILRIKQAVVAFAWLLLIFAVALLTPFSQEIRFGISIFLLVVALYKLLMWEHRSKKQLYALDILRPGYGTFRPKGLTESGRLMSLQEMRTGFYWEPGGILQGTPLPEHQPFGLFNFWVGAPMQEHVLTIASTGAGKGRKLLIPNLLTYPGSALVIDPKGELTQITSGRRGKGGWGRVRENMGQDVYVLDLDGTTEKLPLAKELPLASWNPLGELNIDDPRLYDHVSLIANSLVPIPDQSSGSSNLDAFFSTHAQTFLTAVLLYVLYEKDHDQQNLVYVNKLITQGDQEFYDYAEQECAKNNRQMPYANPLEALYGAMSEGNCASVQSGFIAGEIQTISNMAEQERSGVISTIKQHLAFLHSPMVQRILSRSDFSLRALKERPTTIYLCIGNSSLGTKLKNLLRLVLELGLHTMEEVSLKTPHNVLFVIDEFYSFGHLETIDKGIGLLRGYGVTLWPVIQTLSQLKAHYPSSYENFLTNCHKSFFGELDNETVKWVEDRGGAVDENGARRPFLSTQNLRADFLNKEEGRLIYVPQGKPMVVLEGLNYEQHFPKTWYDERPSF